eukprot:scaffold13249_cov118-Isochrysis_galbana.AAC.11
MSDGDTNLLSRSSTGEHGAHRLRSVGVDRSGHELHRVGGPIYYARRHCTRGEAHGQQGQHSARARPNSPSAPKFSRDVESAQARDCAAVPYFTVGTLSGRKKRAH